MVLSKCHRCRSWSYYGCCCLMKFITAYAHRCRQYGSRSRRCPESSNCSRSRYYCCINRALRSLSLLSCRKTFAMLRFFTVMRCASSSHLALEGNLLCQSSESSSGRSVSTSSSFAVFFQRAPFSLGWCGMGCCDTAAAQQKLQRRNNSPNF